MSKDWPLEAVNSTKDTSEGLTSSEVSKVEEEISEMTKDEPERLFTETPAERLTPMKFVSPHIKGIFGPVKGIVKIKSTINRLVTNSYMFLLVRSENLTRLLGHTI